MQKKLILLMTISCLIIAFDQLTKTLVHTSMQLHDSRVIIENFFSITYVRNFGAAFGILAQTPSVFRDIFFLAMPPIACLLILFIIWGLETKLTAQIVSLSFVFGGAIGNYIDRLQYHYVIDFIDFHYRNKQTWPAFNIADMAIVCGVGSLLFFMTKEKKTSDALNKTALMENKSEL